MSICLSRAADRRGKERVMRRTVATYSHETTMHGGGTDHRTVFGLGEDWTPMELRVFWPNGHITVVGEEELRAHLNNMTLPLKA